MNLSLFFFYLRFNLVSTGLDVCSLYMFSALICLTWDQCFVLPTQFCNRRVISIIDTDFNFVTPSGRQVELSDLMLSNSRRDNNNLQP